MRLVLGLKVMKLVKVLLPHLQTEWKLSTNTKKWKVMLSQLQKTEWEWSMNTMKQSADARYAESPRIQSKKRKIGTADGCSATSAGGGITRGVMEFEMMRNGGHYEIRLTKSIVLGSVIAAPVLSGPNHQKWMRRIKITFISNCFQHFSIVCVDAIFLGISDHSCTCTLNTTD
jgi:hypothetical protein